MDSLLGAGVAIVTPFTPDNKVDVKALQNLVEHCIAGGLDYLVVLGTTGESPNISPLEKKLVMKTVSLANAGRLPLAIGVGGNNTMAVVQELQEMDYMDYDFVLSVSPAYNRPTQEGIYQHFKAVGQASKVPVILYNVPARTGSNMEAETTLRIARDIDNVVAIKEACGNSVQIDKIIQGKPDDFLVISGDDFTALQTILSGGSGVISVLGQAVPHEFSQMIQLGLSGQVDEAYQYHQTLLDGMHMIFEEGNPAGIKSLLKSLGICDSRVRLPLLPATKDLENRLARWLHNLQYALV